MPTIEGKYLGSLRTEATHLKSSNRIITDAPVDNQGKGEAFSPTDLVCAALGSCMMTIMGIVAQREDISLEGLSLSTTKHMAAEPRRISKIEIHFSWKNAPALSAAQVQKLKNAARTCPVALSLHPEIEQVINFDF
ncbi:OsmC family protein [Nafulsella turpanensis]|uniref:OsmC family protein n=1 Tax=Nafulsella turpanensis TaxID=1265690 RepID=UPI00034C6A4D|nr:OsmC family protein [Nafulsella turpanensis]